MKYQQQAPTREDVTGWWREKPQAGIGVVLGKNSGVFCVDIDGEQGEQTLKTVGIDFGQCQTVRQQTPRGRHYFFTYPNDGIPHLNFKGGEVRSDGHYVNVYPSIHSLLFKEYW